MQTCDSLGIVACGVLILSPRRRQLCGLSGNDDQLQKSDGRRNGRFKFSDSRG